jgi:hypothetical protein
MRNSTLVIIILSCLFLSCNPAGRTEHDVTVKTMAAYMQYKQEGEITIINPEEAEIISHNETRKRIKRLRYIPFYSEKAIGRVDKLIIHDNHVVVRRKKTFTTAGPFENNHIPFLSGAHVHAIYNNAFIGLIEPHTAKEPADAIADNKITISNEELNDILKNKVNDNLEFIRIMYELQE